jgi:hypothetical protein
VFLLLDLLADPDVSAKVVLEHRIDSLEQFFNSVVKPREYEVDERIKSGLKRIMEQGKLAYYTRPKQKVPTYSQFIDELSAQRRDSADKPHYMNAIDCIHDAVVDYVEEHGLSIDQIALQTIEQFKVHEKSGLYAWATTRATVLDTIRKKQAKEKEEVGGLTAEKIRDLLESEEKLVCISISDPYTIKDLVVTLTQDLLARRKRKFQVKPYILLVFDEAQEFVPETGGSGGIEM